MENKITGCGMQANPNKYFETTDSLTDYLSKELVIYYFSQLQRIIYGCKDSYKLLHNPDVILKPSEYFWGKVVDEIIDKHHRFSLAKISIEADIDLRFIGNIWIGKVNQMPLDIGHKILDLHKGLRPDLN